MSTKTIGVEIPIGRKALIATDNVRYDSRGNWLGREVVEVQETFTREEAERLQQILGCPECGGIGEHKTYWVRTGQDNFGTVNGYNKPCSRGKQ